MKRLIILVLLMQTALCSTAYAQQVSNVTMRKVNNSIEVIFDLSGAKNLRINLEIMFIEKTTEEQIIPKTISGELQNVSPGKGKIIIWHVLSDRQYVDAELKATVTISDYQYINAPAKLNSTVGGPQNAFLSMLLPGLGDVFVNDNDKVAIKPTYITLCFLSSAGLALYCRSESKKYYEAYQTSVQQYEINSNYENAVYYNDNAKLMTGIACTIWAVDVIRVAAKGFSNRKWTNSSNSAGHLIFKPGITNATLVYHF